MGVYGVSESRPECVCVVVECVIDVKGGVCVCVCVFLAVHLGLCV